MKKLCLTLGYGIGVSTYFFCRGPPMVLVFRGRLPASWSAIAGAKVLPAAPLGAE